MPAELAAECLRTAQQLPAAHCARLAEALRRCASPDEARRRGIDGLVTAPAYGIAVRRLLAAWERPDVAALSGGALALALATGARAAQVAGRAASEVVWTGPLAGTSVRLTAAVLAEVVAGARERLLVLSFAAYRVPEVLSALADAATRGVRVDVVLDTTEDSGGKLSFDQAGAFAALAGVRVWHWPGERRKVAGAVLHAKALVADGRVALVTSANLTGHALAHNIELGVLLHDPGTVADIEDHVRGLIARDVLARFA